MFAINLYALRHTTDTVPSHQFTKDELKVKHLILEMLAGALSAYLLPIYTMNDNSALLDYYALPASKLFLYFSDVFTHYNYICFHSKINTRLDQNCARYVKWRNVY